MRQNNERSDLLEFEGEVVEALPSATFNVKVDKSDMIIIATIAGRLRKNKIRVLVGDRVRVETSTSDVTRGRISWRK